MRLEHVLADLRAAAEHLSAEYPELAADDLAFLGTLEGITDGIEVAERLAERAIHLSSLEDAAAERAKAMHARARRFAAEQDRLKNLILMLVDAAGGRKIVRATLTLSPRSLPPRLLEIDASKTPPDYLKQPPPEADKAKIKEALKLGAQIEGWSLSNGARTIAVLVR